MAVRSSSSKPKDAQRRQPKLAGAQMAGRTTEARHSGLRGDNAVPHSGELCELYQQGTYLGRQALSSIEVLRSLALVKVPMGLADCTFCHCQ